MNVFGQLRLPVVADVITPFMFVTGARLICANLIIAGIETLILRRLFKSSGRRLYGWMVAANYFSAIVGGILLMMTNETIRDAFQPIVLHVKSYLIAMFVIAMILSFVLELPFVIAARKAEPGGIGKSVLACAAAQLGSYAVLVPIYLAMTRVQFGGNVHPVNSLDFVTRKSDTVLFLSPDDQSVYRVRLDGSEPEGLMNVVGHTPHTRPNNLTIWKARDSNQYDLWLTDMWNLHIENGTGEDRLLQQGIAVRYPHWEPNQIWQTVDWRPAAPREWGVDLASNEYSHRGFKAHNAATGEDIRIVVDTPFESWMSRCPTFLADGEVVFEISGQIVVLDLATRKLGFVAYGHSPVVIE